MSFLLCLFLVDQRVSCYQNIFIFFFLCRYFWIMIKTPLFWKKKKMKCWVSLFSYCTVGFLDWMTLVVLTWMLFSIFNFVFVEQIPEMDSWLQQGFHKWSAYKETMSLMFFLHDSLWIMSEDFFTCLAAVFPWEVMFRWLTAITV